MSFRWSIFGFLVLLGLTAGALGAEPLSTKLPPDTLCFIEIDPTAFPPGQVKNADSSVLLELGVQTMASLGLVPDQASALADGLALAANAGTNRNVVALLDADLRATNDGGLDCRSVQVVWLLDVKGRPQPVLERLGGVLKTLSTQKTARQSIKKTAEEKRQYVEFRDTSWPEWLKLAWMQDGDLFVITLGDGAMEHYLSDRPVGGVPWAPTLASGDALAAKQGSSGAAALRAYVTLKAFRERFAEVTKRTAVGRLIDAMELGGASEWALTARMRQRLISVDASSVEAAPAGRMTVTPWTVPHADALALAKLVPEQAQGYLVMDVDWPRLYARVTALLDAVLSDPSDVPMRQRVDGFCLQQKVDFSKDILENLQPRVLIHDYPQHPLRLPLMVTMIGAAKEDRQERAQKATQTIFKAWSEGLAKKFAERQLAPESTGGLSRVQIRTDKEGETYIQYGLIGPAWKWSEGKWVFSWSPAAVRYNLPGIKGASAKDFETPQR